AGPAADPDVGAPAAARRKIRAGSAGPRTEPRKDAGVRPPQAYARVRRGWVASRGRSAAKAIGPTRGDGRQAIPGRHYRGLPPSKRAHASPGVAIRWASAAAARPALSDPEVGVRLPRARLTGTMRRRPVSRGSARVRLGSWETPTPIDGPAPG